MEFQVFRFLGISGLRDRSWRILRKISVPNDPFLWRLLTAVSRKLGTEDFLLNVWRIPRCSFSRSKITGIIAVILVLFLGEKGRENGKNGGKSEKGKKQKRIRPNGRQIRNLQVKISLSPNFGAERTLIDPISVTSKFHIFQRFFMV